jgi:hypothetical protein|tara:strand:+ start:40 stop:729 length:690 start_codon:yes stop_codon:yes gene_type:complete
MALYVDGTEMLALSKGIGDGNVLAANDVVADDDFLRINGTEVEGLTSTEVLTALAAAPAGALSNAVAGKGFLMAGDGDGGSFTISNPEAKGDIFVCGLDMNTMQLEYTRLPIGTNDHVLTADSSQWTGVKWAAGSSSDERLKKDVVTIPDALDKVLALRGVNFKWKDEAKGTHLRMGMIAQEIELVIPEVVNTQDDEMGTKAVEYQLVVGVLIEAVKELSAKVEALENA